MQVIDWISSHGWSDRPACVHPALRKAAIAVNDSLDDAGRQKLLELVPRLMGTNTGGKCLSLQLAVYAARQVLPIYEERYPGDVRPRVAIESAEAWIVDPCLETSRASVAAADAARDAARDACIDGAGLAAAYSASYAAHAVVFAAGFATGLSVACDAVASACSAFVDKSVSYASDAANRFEFLVSLLDEYDRLTGRGMQDAVDFTEVALVMEGASS
jgi:hypothetical protein